MATKHGPWQILQSERVFQNDFIEVRHDHVTQPDGQPGQYATVIMKPGVAVLPVGERGEAFLTRQFRYALGRESLEAPCGAVDGDEPAEQAARRELREELGLEASDWIDLGTCDLDTSIVRCPVRLFMARGLTFTEAEREGTETIETVELPLAGVVQRVMAGAITHGPSCAVILKSWLKLHPPAPSE